MISLIWRWIWFPGFCLADKYQSGNPETHNKRDSETAVNDPAVLKSEILRLRTELEKQTGENLRLKEEIDSVKKDLEEKIKARTRELSESNILLLDELSERESIEESLRESESRLSLLAETTGDVLYRLVYETRHFDYLNSAIEKLTGYTHSEINKIGFARLVLKVELHDLPHNKNYTDLKNVKYENCTTQFSADYLIRRKDGQLIWVGDHSYPWYDSNGKVTGSVGVLQDITKRRTYENTIKRHDEILKSISFEAELFLKSSNWRDNIQLVLKTIGEAAQVSRTYLFEIHKNTQHEQFFSMTYEWTAEGIEPQIPKPWQQNIPVNHPGGSRIFEMFFENKVVCGTQEDFQESESAMLKAMGIKSILNVPVFVNDELWGFIGFDECKNERLWSTLEIESLKTAADVLSAAVWQNNSALELIKAKEMAERSNQLKTDFLTQVSHEIRTPLNNILNYASLIKEEVENKSFEALPVFFEIISNSGKRLTRTIDLILDMSQIQTKNYEPKFREMDLYKDILKELLESHSIGASQKAITFVFEDTAENKTILGDNYTVMQIFDNLIDNAVKYTPSGEVTIKLYNLNGSVGVDVKDTGIGISDEYLPELFTPFSQEEMGYSRRYDGNGLGLALVKKYVELNQAEIIVKTEKGAGSVFTIIFNKPAES